MKILFSTTAPRKAELPNGRYACMYEGHSSWRMVIVRMTDGKVVERSSADASGPNGRENIRRCFSRVVEAGVEELLLWTTAFAEVHATLETFTDCEIEVEVAEELEFPLDLSSQ